jgi:uncharacterized repeat protein (TIGR03803 family)
MTTAGVITTLHTFTGSDGANPVAGLIRATDGNLYGTTQIGGTSNNGTVFRITTGGTFTTLYNFSGSDGSSPMAGLVQAADGNLYGTTQSGGTSRNGTVFKITTAGVLTTLYSFSGSDGRTRWPAWFRELELIRIYTERRKMAVVLVWEQYLRSQPAGR